LCSTILPVKLFNGIGDGLSYDAVTPGWEYFVLGQIQAAGTEGHRRTGWLQVAAVFAALIVEVSTTSRATAEAHRAERAPTPDSMDLFFQLKSFCVARADAKTPLG
jgi:hypothetical protein